MEAWSGSSRSLTSRSCYERGVNQFRSNMEATLIFSTGGGSRYSSAISYRMKKTLGHLVSVAADSIRFPGFKKDYELGVTAYDNKDTAAAAKWFGEANQIYDGHARCNFYLGRLACNVEIP